MVTKTQYSKPNKIDFPRFYNFRGVSPLSFTCFCTLSLILNLACYTNPVNSTPSDNKGSPSRVPESIKGFSKETSNSIECENLVNKLEELESLILRQGQAARQALLQAKESCRGDSAVDCGYWTERANRINRQVRELYQETQKIKNQQNRNNCIH